MNNLKKKGLLLLLSLAFVTVSRAETYYLDPVKGLDTNTGISSGKAWKTLDKVNGHTFLPGDKLLIKRGSEFYGQLELKGSGSHEQPIILDVYGKGEKPIIHGKGEKKHTLLLSNVQYWEVNNLAVTNTGAEREFGRCGVSVKAFNSGDMHHIYLNGLTVKDVNGGLVKAKGGGCGILWNNGGDSIKSRFIDLRIENCHIKNCARNGIISGGYAGRSKWYPSLGVIVRGNLLEQVPGDGIVPIGCDGALIEYNVMRDCPDILSHEEAAAGIWPWSCDNTVIQFNEVSGHNAKWDGQGFDSDYNCRNTVIQYNYSHDNAGGFLLVCNDGFSLGQDYNHGTDNTIVRYNISVNDGTRTYPTKQAGFFSPVFHITGPVKNTKIYNNVIIVDKKTMPEIDRDLVKMGDWGNKFPEDTWFANNIFYTAEKSTFNFGGDKNTQFTNNLYYGDIANLPTDAPERAIFADPGFISLLKTHDKDEVLKCLRLKESSPARGTGICIENWGEKDFWNQTPDKAQPMNIGAYQGK